MIDDFSRRYRNEIEMLVHWTRGHVDRRKVTKELKRYIEEYGIDINEACKALAMKWADFNDHAYQSPALDSMEPPPKFALDTVPRYGDTTNLRGHLLLHKGRFSVKVCGYHLRFVALRKQPF